MFFATVVTRERSLSFFLISDFYARFFWCGKDTLLQGSGGFVPSLFVSPLGAMSRCSACSTARELSGRSKKRLCQT